MKKLDKEKLKDIARFQLNYMGRGSFLTALLEAFLRADKDNTELMLPLIRQIVGKYDMAMQYERFQKAPKLTELEVLK